MKLLSLKRNQNSEKLLLRVFGMMRTFFSVFHHFARRQSRPINKLAHNIEMVGQSSHCRFLPLNIFVSQKYLMLLFSVKNLGILAKEVFSKIIN